MTRMGDEELERTLVASVLAAREQNPGAVGALPISLQAHFVACIVEREVLEGGFNQLQFKAPEIASMAPDAFVHLGMDEAAVIAQDAWHLHDVVRVRHDEARRQGTFAAFSATYEPPVFEELDLMYTDSAERFRAARIGYVRSHPAEFDVQSSPR